MSHSFANANENGGHAQTSKDSKEHPIANGNSNPDSTSSYTIPEKVADNTNICLGSTQHTMSLFDLTGKTALVTGGNGGIGGGMARGLAETGADIIIFQIPGELSKFPTTLSLETGRTVSVYDCDMANTLSIRAAVAKVIADGLVIDILCNCAGISSGSEPALTETDEHKDKVEYRFIDYRSNAYLRKLIQINFNSVWVMCQAVGGHVANRGKGGKIINVASIAAQKTVPGFSVYGPTKAAVGQLTNSFAVELGSYNIQVNCLFPG
jgi:NAD(P)-dependent dehydrogenase (short-subunit alcohol dehydrogenase family)